MNTQEKFVITVSRELGSGGHTIGLKLAERLGVRFCDKELLNALTEKFDLNPSAIERLKGQKKNWIADFIRQFAPAPSPSAFIASDSIYGKEYDPKVTPDEIFIAEKEILRGLAEEESCVITGRSGFFVLKDHPNKFDIFITASREHRIARVMRKQQLDRELAEEVINKVDTMRENYIQRYAKTSRYDLRNYTLTLNVDTLTEDQAVDVILGCIQQ